MAFAFLMLVLAALQTPPPEPRGWYECSVEREDATGTVSAYLTIPTSGAPRVRETGWRPSYGPNGIILRAVWASRPSGQEIAPGEVVIYLLLPPARVILRRIGPGDVRETRFTGEFPNGGIGYARIGWDRFLAIGRGAAALEIAAVDENGREIRSVRIAPADLDRAEAMVTEIQPEFDAVVADYRNRCAFQDPRYMIPTS